MIGPTIIHLVSPTTVAVTGSRRGRPNLGSWVTSVVVLELKLLQAGLIQSILALVCAGFHRDELYDDDDDDNDEIAYFSVR